MPGPRSSQIYPYISYGRPRIQPYTELATTGSLAAETAARIAADNAEAAARAAADNTLQANINLKADIASPTFTGDPKAPTPPTADNDTSIATTAYVQAQGYATSVSVAAGDNLRVLKAGDTMTGALGINAAPTGADLVVGGGAFFGTGAAAGDAVIEIGQGRSGSGNAYIDLHAASGTDYETRFIRGSGANGNFAIQNAGTGTLQLLTAGSATAILASNGNWSLSGSSGFLSSAGNLVRTGTLGSTGSSAFNINWTGSVPQLWIDNVNLGTISITCDYRIKDNIAPLESTWNKVKGLRPISYTIADYEIFKADSEERWGFLAHELQETLLPSAASGNKDAPDEIQSPDLMAVVASLIKALQEAMDRIEALEAR